MSITEGQIISKYSRQPLLQKQLKWIQY